MSPLPAFDFASSTALVTGATSGIGRAIAFELVSRGIGKLIIHGRNAEKIAATEAELKKKTSKTDIRTVKADISKHDGDNDGPAAIESQVKAMGWTVDLLVNNAGLARKYIFAKDTPNDTALESIDVMVRAVVDMSLRFPPGMVERRRGGVLNIGSTSAYQPVPWTAAYAASEAFILSFSQAIREEQRQLGTGVRYALISPGITVTNLNPKGGGEDRGKLNLLGKHQPEDVAVAAIDCFLANTPEHTLGVNNKLLKATTYLLSSAKLATLVSRLRGMPED